MIDDAARLLPAIKLASGRIRVGLRGSSHQELATDQPDRVNPGTTWTRGYWDVRKRVFVDVTDALYSEMHGGAS